MKWAKTFMAGAMLASRFQAKRLASAWLAILLTALPARAATVTWLPTGGTNDWFGTNNWSTTNVPAAGDDIIINVAGATNWVLLTNFTAPLGSLLMSNRCTLIFSNWDTALSATNVSILSNSSMTCVGAFTNNAMSNRVYIICTNLTIASGGSINVDYKGYSGGLVLGAAHGPGGAIDSRGGGGYGGSGGNFGWYNGKPYGSANAPEYAGSGGGFWPANGGHGGGAVRIDASGGTVTLNGLITANGQPAVSAGGGSGSGGGVWISCRTLTGTVTTANTCMIRANGGTSPSGNSGGSGGGGRIAIVYDPTAQSALPIPPLNLSVNGGTYSYVGEMGTIYLPDGQFLTETMSRMTGEILGVTSWTATNLVVSNCTIRFAAAGFRLAVSNDLHIVDSGSLQLGGDAFLTNASVGAYAPYVRYTSTTSAPALFVSGDLVVTNNSALHIYSAMTNNTTPNYGSLVSIQGDVSLSSNSWIYPVSHPTNGGSVRFMLKNLSVKSGCGFSAAKRGFAGGGDATAYGPGKGGSRSGGGYGGGGGYTSGGTTYGSSNAPTLPGSGGGRWASDQTGIGGNGGGLIRIIASEGITNNGTLNANGDGIDGNSGSGSGGGIYLMCRSFNGSGSLAAAGGSKTGVGGDGGGGRIAVWYDVRNALDLENRLSTEPMYRTQQGTTNPPPSFTGTVSVAAGTGYPSLPAQPGTVLFIQVPPPGTIFTIH